MIEFWDEWRGSLSGDVVMRIKHLLRRGGVKLDLHKMVGPDAVDCFHTHPARSLRVILWGGYVEQAESGIFQKWGPGRAGFVLPETSHRIDRLLNGAASYSLWLRWPKTHEIELRGAGWKRTATALSRSSGGGPVVKGGGGGD